MTLPVSCLPVMLKPFTEGRSALRQGGLDSGFRRSGIPFSVVMARRPVEPQGGRI